MQQPSSVTRGRPRGFHSSMPRSNPHARERVMDDRKHLDALASFVPFAGRETSGVSSAGWSRGSASKLLRTQSVTKRCSRMRRVGALLHLPSTEGRGILDSGLSARADEESRPQGWWSSSPARLALPPNRSNTDVGNRSDGKRPVVLPGGESHSGPAAIRRRRSGPCACTACRSQRGTDLSKGSCSRSVRSGRSRTNGDVVVDARSNGRPERRAEAKRSGGNLEARVIARPMEGALDHQYWWRPSRDVVGGWSWLRSRRHLLISMSGGLLRWAKARHAQACNQEGRRNVVTRASEDGARSTSREENARVRKDENRPIRSAWGVVKRAMHLQGLANGTRKRTA
jgi:hypothetical protein